MAGAGTRHPRVPPALTSTTGARLAVVDEPGLQRRYSPASRCFGCGPANEQGLRIESHQAPWAPGELRAVWQPLPHHAAFDGILNGGVIGTL
ncbi:MAG: hypothetical protein QOC97_701, partial [Chloroflexota bacterium]|nr:hypothetical protein [Chloroflexota bacterium]